MKVLFLSIFLLLGINCRQLLRIEVEEEKRAIELRNLIERFDLDVWSNPAPFTVDVLVSSDMASRFTSLGFNFDILIEDVEQMISEERIRMANNKDAEFFEEYQSLESIINFCSNLCVEHPNIISNFSIGTTYEGREIYGYRITSGGSGNKPVFFFNGGIHAREWISHATVTYMVNELVHGYGQNQDITRYLDSIEVIVIPVLNPDGYVYTQTDRMWRKNREPNQGSSCVGTDLNRNWGYQWNTGGSSNFPCSDSYHGTGPFSCIESSMVEKFVNQTDNIVAYIDFHAYSQLIMTPWGYTTQFPADDDYQKEVGEKQRVAIEAVYGTSYRVGNIANIIYVASGSSADYFYGVHGTVLSYGYELRDTGRYGFLLPPDQIIPSGIETFEALKVVLEEIYNTHVL